GFNEVLRTARVLGGGRTFLVALNDRLADGRDVSWIWDADFELLHDAQTVVVTGDRAPDMALRLEYAGIPATVRRVCATPAAALDALLEATTVGGEAFILPTYTSMLELRAEMAERGWIRPFWEQAQ
ncbi:MAG: DUF1727 domain-containing protein, partial [Candidatus Dormibacteria bacterium]